MNRPSNSISHKAHPSSSAVALRAHLRCAELNTLGSIRIADQLTRLADVAESARRNNESVL